MTMLCLLSLCVSTDVILQHSKLSALTLLVGRQEEHRACKNE